MSELKNLLPLLKTGDIIGQSFAFSNSEFGKAARVFEKISGPISHVGIIDMENSWILHRPKKKVIEAAEFVTQTPIEKFIADGNGKFCVFRLKEPLTADQERAIMGKARSWLKKYYKFLNKEVKYDKKLIFGDEELYCSELVEIAYNEAGIKLADRKYDLQQIENAIANLFNKRMFGKEFTSTAEAFGLIWGQNGYYYNPETNPNNKSLVRNIIMPHDVCVNSKTIKIFSNMPGV